MKFFTAVKEKKIPVFVRASMRVCVCVNIKTQEIHKRPKQQISWANDPKNEQTKQKNNKKTASITS